MKNDTVVPIRDEKGTCTREREGNKSKTPNISKSRPLPIPLLPGEIFILYQSNPPPFFPLVLFLSYYPSFLLCPPAGNWYTFRREKSDLQELFSNYLQRGTKHFLTVFDFYLLFFSFFYHSFRSSRTYCFVKGASFVLKHVHSSSNRFDCRRRKISLGKVYIYICPLKSR